jgi:arylsulfatase A-like enzyme
MPYLIGGRTAKPNILVIMVEHDGQVGQLLAELQKLGIQNNTIVIYTTDNCAELLLWPDGA